MPLIDSYAILGCAAPCSGAFDRDQLIRRMDALGITHSIVTSSLAIASDFEAGNEYLASQIEGQKRLLGYAVVNTNHPAQSIETMRKYMTRRQFVGMLLIEGDAKTPVNSHDAEEILNAYRRYGKPLLISAPNRECVYGAGEVARKFDQMKVVLVDMGGLDWRSAIAAAVANLNIYLTTTGEVSPDKVREGWTAVKGNRMIFGSGVPLVDPAVVLGMVDEVSLAEREKQQLLSSNSERLFAG